MNNNEANNIDDAKLYRILSPTAILGYGFPEASFKKAMEMELDLIAVDAGSMDAGPYYLGSASQYVGRAALERDLSFMVNGALQQNCPMIVGSAGFSGASPAMDEVVEIIKTQLKNAGVDSVRLAVIKSDIAPSTVQPVLDKLEALGRMPELDEDVLEKSKMVGQMGMEPIISALAAGAQFIVCGRAYDPAVFAADPIRKGFPIGPALHASKILECGAIACEPGSGSDCLVAELYLDGRAEFIPPNENRSATIKSISAHTLYEKSRPDIFHLPGGVLDIRETRFYESDGRKAGFSGSRFIPMPYSIKIEGSVAVGMRSLSLGFAKTASIDSDGILIYGKNGIEENSAPDPLEEIGILCEVKGSNRQQTKDALAFIRSTLLHFGYEGRLATAGNLAFPFSPSDFIFANGDVGFTGIFFAGTRDPVFQKKMQESFTKVLEALENQHPLLAQNCQVAFYIGNKEKPLLLIENLAEDSATSLAENKLQLQNIEGELDSEKPVYLGIEGGLCYQWSVHHLLHDKETIKKMFPIEIFQLRGEDSEAVESLQADYSDSFQLEVKPEELVIEIKEQLREEIAPSAQFYSPLQELVTVVRSKNAGVNELTFDVLFKNEEAYQSALRSGVFSRKSIAQLFQVETEEVLGSYAYDPVRAIKFTLIRPLVSGSLGERDVFGAQQHTRLLGLQIPQ